MKTRNTDSSNWKRIFLTPGIPYQLSVLGVEFWSRAYLPPDLLDPLACWLWIPSINSWSYGQFYNKELKRNVSATRMIMTALKGTLEHSTIVCHKCDHPPCVSYHHLILGTNKFNSQDRVVKGRVGLPQGVVNNEFKLYYPQGD